MDQNGQLTLNQLIKLTGGGELLATKNFKLIFRCVCVCARV